MCLYSPNCVRRSEFDFAKIPENSCQLNLPVYLPESDNHRRMVMRANSLLALIATSAISGFTTSEVLRAEETGATKYPRFDQPTIDAWQKRGFSAGWMGKLDDSSPLWFLSSDRHWLRDPIPAFHKR